MGRLRVSQTRAASTSRRISRTARSMPTIRARLTMEWPMFSSSISRMAATAPTLS